jgi:RNA polymerase sigma-70 factor (ECF subfamily)
VNTFLPSARLSILPAKAEGKQSTSPIDRGSATDERLLLRLQHGESDAISALFKRHASAIYRIGQKVLRDSGEADDLVQEVFLYLYRRSELFDQTKGSARSWIFQVAYTQAFIRRRHLVSSGFYSSTDSFETSQITAPHTTTEYDQTAEAVFGRKAWRKVLESLSDDQRETLRLHFFEGYTFAEIAEKLGQRYGSVRNHHYRGLEKVRKHLADSELNKR